MSIEPPNNVIAISNQRRGGGHKRENENSLKSDEFERNSGGMDMTDYRLQRIESDVSEIKSVLGRMEPVLARTDERLKHVPTSVQLVWAIVLACLAMAGLLVALLDLK